jgi:hypothetical protein
MGYNNQKGSEVFLLSTLYLLYKLQNTLNLFSLRPKTMRYLLLLLFLLPFGLTAQTKTEREILDTELRRFEAMTRRDTILLQKLLSDDLFYIHSNALIENKLTHITAIATGKLVYEKMTRESVAIRRYGKKTALTNGILAVSGIINNTAFQLRLQYTAVYRKNKKTWQLANWQSTRIP